MQPWWYYLMLVWGFVCSIWFWVVPKVFRVINFFKPRISVSRIRNDILLQSATSLAVKIRNGELTSEIVVRSYIERCQEVNSLINAIVEDNFDNAVKQAKLVDEQIANDTAPSFQQAPFLGVPFTVKNCILVEGLSCSVGMHCRRNKRATEDAVVVELMKKAGGIPFLVTNVCEACMWWETFNTLHGRTNNPYDIRRSVGGSSGGEGALISAAGSVIGIGTDAAGSIRIPSYFNGIFGHKPTANIIDTKGSHAHIRAHKSNMFVAGPMCRYAEDLLPMLTVMAGPNVGYLNLNRSVDLSKLKIFYMYDIRTSIASPVQSELKETIRKVINYFSIKYNVLSIKLDLSFIHYAFPILLSAVDNPEFPTLTEIMCHCEADLKPAVEFLKYLFGYSTHTFTPCSLALLESVKFQIGTDVQRKNVKRMGEILCRQFNELLNDTGVFILPPHPTVVPFHKQSLFTPLDCIYSSFINTLGLPSTSCPIGTAKNGMPLGVQIIGAANRDYVTIAVAQELERIFGGWKEPCQ